MFLSDGQDVDDINVLSDVEGKLMIVLIYIWNIVLLWQIKYVRVIGKIKIFASKCDIIPTYHV